MIETVASWFKALLAWFGRIFEWFLGMFKDFMEFIADLPLLIFKGVMEGALYLINALPVPQFLVQYKLQTLFSGLPESVLWFIQFFGIPQGLAILGAGVAFRLLRKALTLGQW
ncbi:hypothetical protein BM547_32520 [Pseudomonas aeruginosa]|nr:hypothetical protein YH69_16240 [Pseudomonas aeruginosa]OKR53016.1 hypothetical protein BH597_31030 [Pseudomonas aeruginosa]OKS25631.1 hypothetical protein BH606_02785 [Pseudomonas aeruginosa]OKS31352.1 hypothetical protein BH609_28540 [Pseudomonas aeruginosa]OOK44733.1 hypothetical protein BM547_32520 [Pseudomonas aeruginosa]